MFETFIFDFSGDLYDSTLEIALVSFLREEAKFENVEALVAQMDRDSAKARQILARAKAISPLDARLGLFPG
jgi:riboflavin kinase/FMN adenylyltransferase